MKMRTLGKSEVKVTPIAFGAWAIGGWMWGGADENDAIKAIHTSYDAGITTIDTAPVYGFGKSEEIVGKAMKNKSRDSYQLLTKFGMNWTSEQGDFYFDTIDNDGKPIKVYKWASKDRVIKECEDSLRRLQTDYIDLYQIHWPDKTTPVQETFEAVQKLIEQGKIRAAGVCNYNTELVDDAMQTIQLASNQVPYSLINRGIENDVIPQAIKKGMSIIPYSPLQRGLLTGKIKPGHKFEKGDSRKGNPFFTDENIRRANELLKKLDPIAEKHKASLAQLVLNWTMNQPGIGCVLAGARNEKQVKDNVGALEFNLSNEDMELITEASDNFNLDEEEK
ncbi:MAG: aldo/keto reductase [Ginsengibacter sp.]